MADDLRSAIEGALNEPSSDPVAVVSPSPAEGAVEEAPAATEGVPASGGEVTAQPEKAPVAEAEPRASEEEPEAEAEAAPVTTPTHRIDRAPASWKGEAKKVWDTLPLQARQEVIRRERDITRSLQEHAQDRQRVESVQKVLQPYADIVQSSYGGNPLQAIHSLLQVERVLSSAPTTDKAKFVANLIKHYKVDVELLDQHLSGNLEPGTQQVDQIDQILSRRLAPLEQFILTQQQQQQQRPIQAQAEINNTIESMAADSVKYPYFEDVRESMADLIELNSNRGVYLSLEDAYNKAVRMDDTLNQGADTRAASQAAIQAALAAHQAAQKAKGAAVSVTGAPSGVGGSAINPNDLRSVIAANIESVGGRS